MNITDVNTTYLTKNEYKSLVDGAIKRKKRGKKQKANKNCEKIMRETFGKKNYITKNNSRKLPDRKMLQFKI